MIIVGDIACPGQKEALELQEILKGNDSFKGNSLLFNFEGMVAANTGADTLTPVLFNHPSVLPVLKEAGAKMLPLANNHTLDLPENLNETVAAGIAHGMPVLGAGKSKSEAAAPVTFEDGGYRITVFNFCWDFLLYHQNNPTKGVYVATLDENKLLEDVKAHKAKNPDDKVIVMIHWSFDLENLPFPQYRQFSKALIDAGVNVVAGCHSHCVQGGEKYNDGYIVYGLGNFFLPYNIFANGTLTFPEFSRTELGLEWNPVTNEAVCHWFYYENENGRNNLKFIEANPFETCARLKSYSPYMDMGHAEYIAYYKKNRRKKVLIPVYKDYRDVFGNSVKTFLLKTRGRTARLLAKLKIINWQN